MNLSSKCSKCAEIFSFSAGDGDGDRALAAFKAWRAEHTHFPSETAPQTREPARGPGRPKKEN